MRPTLEIEHPDGRKEVIELSKKQYIVGRASETDIHISDTRISRQHCMIELNNGQIYVTDLGGNNGTWLNQKKLLANVPEPAPANSIVHVGPAKLKNVSARPQIDPDNNVESEIFIPTRPERNGGQRGGGAVQKRPQASSDAGIELQEYRVTVAPGARASLPLKISNEGRIVDHYKLSVSGVPNTWVTLPRGNIELFPRDSKNVTLDFHPPINTRTAAGVHPLSIAVFNEKGDIVAEERAELEVTAFDQLIVTAQPNPLQSRSGGTFNLTVENQGNARTDYRLDVTDPSNALEIQVGARTGQVAPQQTHENTIHVKPYKRIWIGQSKRFTLSTTVSTSQQSFLPTNPLVYNQLNVLPVWLPALLLLLCCLIAPILAFFTFNVLRDTGQLSTATPTATSTATATPTETPFVDTAATATAEWCGKDDDGDTLTNCREMDLGTNPLIEDSDADGLPDNLEVTQHNTNPLDNDSDDDGILDGEEVNYHCFLSPNNPDTDGDGANDGAEIQSGTDPCGLAPTSTPKPTPLTNFAFGGHINDTANLGIADEAGMTWIKKQIRYSPGDNPVSAGQDLLKIKDEGFKVLAAVVGSREDLANGGRGYYQQYAEFVAGLATTVDAIEIWNEPNIDVEWPTGDISAADYTQLLATAYAAIKQANPGAMVISGALAPTGGFTGSGGCSAQGCNDDRYLREMFAAGAKDYMDCLGMHYNSGATFPDDRENHPADGGDHHYSWYFWPMVELYWNTFNPPEAIEAGNIVPLCFTEFGYLSPDGFEQTLNQVGAANFGWAQGVTELDQTLWLRDALIRARCSGQVKMLIIWNIDFTNYGPDPQAGYAIQRPDGKCPACDDLSGASFRSCDA
jgi:hypothetical protein